MIKNKKKYLLLILLIFIFSIYAGFLAQKYLVQYKSTQNLYHGLRLLRDKEDPEKYISEQVSVCNKFNKKDNNRYECLKSVSKILVDQVPFKTIIKNLDSSNLDCHDLMHNVVNAEYRNGAKLPEIWEQCTNSCFGACYHGGLEGLLGQSEFASKDNQDLTMSLINICGSVNVDLSNLAYQCYHGVGHALMLSNEGDLIKSLSGCDRAKKHSQQLNCYEGVFMENLPNSTTTNHITKRFIKDGDPLYPCDSIEKRYQSVCYTFQTSYFFYITNRELPKVIELCGSVPVIYKNSCFSQIGLMQINRLSSDQSKAMRVCGMVPVGESQSSCLSGVVMGYYDRFPNDFAEMKRMGIFKFCENVKLPYKNNCYSKIGQILVAIMHDAKSRERECQAIREIEYKTQCQGYSYKSSSS